jgi:hypothetical protein
MRYFLPLLLMLAAGAGCTHCCHKAYDLALSAEDCDGLPACQRAKVYAVLVNGFDPLHLGHIDKLGAELNRLGFAKVYTVEFHHAAFVESEVRKIRCEQPDARFVFVGYAHGAGVAESVASKLSHEGVPIDALVELTPAYLPWAEGHDLSRVGRHVVIGRECQAACGRANTQVLSLPGVGPYSVATNPVTIQTVRDILTTSTAHVPIEEGPLFPMLPLNDDPAPLPGKGLVIAK